MLCKQHGRYQGRCVQRHEVPCSCSQAAPQPPKPAWQPQAAPAAAAPPAAQAQPAWQPAAAQPAPVPRAPSWAPQQAPEQQNMFQPAHSASSVGLPPVATQQVSCGDSIKHAVRWASLERYLACQHQYLESLFYILQRGLLYPMVPTV